MTLRRLLLRRLGFADKDVTEIQADIDSVRFER
jgi:hypothetical protein